MNCIQSLILALVTTSVISNTNAASTVTHDLTLTDSGQYTIDGTDPYIIFNPLESEGNEPATNASHLILDLGREMNGVPLELFFAAKGDLFDPYSKLSFTASSFPSALALPKEIKLTPLTRLRLDVTQCDDCSIDISKLPTLNNNPEKVPQVEPSNVQNGIKKLTSSPREISSNGWLLNDLTGDVANFEISGADPFLISPRLDVSTSELAGVYVKLMAPDSEKRWNDYQLFYQTEKHSFTRKSSSVIRVFNKAAEFIEFVIPLSFLSAEYPAYSVLERLRLDLPNIPGSWSLIEARLVHQDQSLDIKDLIPAHLIQIKQQRPSRMAIAKRVLIKISSDLGFLIAYLLLLALISALFFRAYKSNK